MRRILLLLYTGPQAGNPKLARRIARKMRGAQDQGICVVCDCEDVEVSEEFLQILVSAARPDKTKLCGLPIIQQGLVARALSRKEGTV
jgi:hypothetical protein